MQPDWASANERGAGRHRPEAGSRGIARPAATIGSEGWGYAPPEPAREHRRVALTVPGPQAPKKRKRFSRRLAGSLCARDRCRTAETRQRRGLVHESPVRHSRARPARTRLIDGGMNTRVQARNDTTGESKTREHASFKVRGACILVTIDRHRGDERATEELAKWTCQGMHCGCDGVPRENSRVALAAAQ